MTFTLGQINMTFWSIYSSIDEFRYEEHDADKVNVVPFLSQKLLSKTKHFVL